MINADFLSQCSDEQINKGVAWLRIIELSRFIFPHDMGIGADGIHYGASIGLLNVRHCSNPNGIMPIAFANFISLRFSKDNAWVARKGMHVSFNNNPLRAICEVYILMSVNK